MASTLVASPLTNFDSTPASPYEVWDLSRLLLAAWEFSIEMETSYDTSVLSGRTSAETRRGFSNKPSRALSGTIKCLGSSRDAWLLLNMARRMGICRGLLPVYPDVSFLTAPASGTSLTFDTTYRRFFPGQYIALGIPENAAGVSTFELKKIATITPPSTVTLTDAVVSSFPARSRVWPLMEVDLALTSEVSILTDRTLQLRFAAQEVHGPQAMPPLLEDNVSGGFAVGPEGYEIFDPANAVNWVNMSQGWKRDGNTTIFGLTTVYDLNGSRPRLTAKRGYTAFSRALAWQILRFFDRCSGPLRPFYVVSPLSLFRPTEVSTTFVKVQKAGPLSDMQALPYIAIMLRQAGDNPTLVRQVTSVTRSGSEDTINFTPSITAPTLQQIRRVTMANLCRFNSETISERWTTSQIVELSYSVLELLEEKVVTTVQ